jgi:translation initiation factor IF-3
MGVMDIAVALEHGRTHNTDVVLVAPLSSPPVCKLQNFAAWIKERASKDKIDRGTAAKLGVAIPADLLPAKSGEARDLKIGVRISDHDLGTKMRKAIEFFSKDNAAIVRFTLSNERKNASSTEEVRATTNRISESLKDYGLLQQPIDKIVASTTQISYQRHKAKTMSSSSSSTGAPPKENSSSSSSSSSAGAVAGGGGGGGSTKDDGVAAGKEKRAAPAPPPSTSSLSSPSTKPSSSTSTSSSSTSSSLSSAPLKVRAK